MALQLESIQIVLMAFILISMKLWPVLQHQMMARLMESLSHQMKLPLTIPFQQYLAQHSALQPIM